MEKYRADKKSNGVCRACGRSNRLFVHQKCGEKMAELRGDNQPKTFTRKDGTVASIKAESAKKAKTNTTGKSFAKANFKNWWGD